MCVVCKEQFTGNSISSITHVIQSINQYLTSELPVQMFRGQITVSIGQRRLF